MIKKLLGVCCLLLLLANCTSEETFCDPCDSPLENIQYYAGFYKIVDGFFHVTNSWGEDKTTYFDEKEVTAIKLRIQENSSLFTSYDRKKLSDMPKTELEEKLIIRQAIEILNRDIFDLQNENTVLKKENLKMKALIEVPPKTLRAKINQMIRSYVRKTEQNFWVVWQHLYNEFFYCYKINLIARAQHRDIAPLDYCEKNPKIMVQLYQLAKKLFIK